MGIEYRVTLQLYDELIKGGCSEAQARVQASQLGAMGICLSKIDKDLIWLRVIGAAMVAIFFAHLFK